MPWSDVNCCTCVNESEDYCARDSWSIRFNIVPFLWRGGSGNSVAKMCGKMKDDELSWTWEFIIYLYCYFFLLKYFLFHHYPTAVLNIQLLPNKTLLWLAESVLTSDWLTFWFGHERNCSNLFLEFLRIELLSFQISKCQFVWRKLNIFYESSFWRHLKVIPRSICGHL